MRPRFQALFQALCLPVRSCRPQNIDTIAPEFENMYAIHANIQLEQAITNDLSFAVGYIHSGGRHIPVYRSINLIPIRFLGGRQTGF